MQKGIAYVLAIIDLAFGDSFAAVWADMLCPCFDLLQDSERI
jgi:hypothetical protein